MSPAKHHAAPFQDALQWLAFFLTWAPGCDWMPLEHHSDTAGRYTAWLQTGSRQVSESAGDELVRRVQTADLEHNEQVLLAIPRMIRAGGVSVGSAFWVVTEGTKQTRRLDAFWPPPSLVLREGASSRRVSFWPLNMAIRWKGLWRGNRNLAYHLGAVQKHGDPDRLEFGAPGTCLRADRGRPVPIICERLEVDSWDPLQVIGRRHDGRRWLRSLREAPDPDAWRDRIPG